MKEFTEKLEKTVEDMIHYKDSEAIPTIVNTVFGYRKAYLCRIEAAFK